MCCIYVDLIQHWAFVIYNCHLKNQSGHHANQYKAFLQLKSLFGSLVAGFLIVICRESQDDISNVLHCVRDTSGLTQELRLLRKPTIREVDNIFNSYRLHIICHGYQFDLRWQFVYSNSSQCFGGKLVNQHSREQRLTRTKQSGRRPPNSFSGSRSVFHTLSMGFYWKRNCLRWYGDSTQLPGCV